jgi:hypothetical protein
VPTKGRSRRSRSKAQCPAVWADYALSGPLVRDLWKRSCSPQLGQYFGKTITGRGSPQRVQVSMTALPQSGQNCGTVTQCRKSWNVQAAFVQVARFTSGMNGFYQVYRFLLARGDSPRTFITSAPGLQHAHPGTVLSRTHNALYRHGRNPNSSAILRTLQPSLCSRRALSRSTTSRGRPRCSVRPWRRSLAIAAAARSERLTRSCLAMTARIAITASLNSAQTQPCRFTWP